MLSPRFLQPPAIARAAPLPAGALFSFLGRRLAVVRVTGDDPTAPVIVEEMEAGGAALPGQFSLWSRDAVLRAVHGAPA